MCLLRGSIKRLEMSFFDSNLKLFKSTRLDIDFGSRKLSHSLKILVVAILADSHDDLIISSSLSSLSREELHDATKVKHEFSTEKINDKEYEVDSLVVSFPNGIFKKQSFTFIRSKPDSNKAYSTLILAKGTPKFTNLTLQWLKSDTGCLIKPVKFNSNFLIECLNIVVNGLSSDKARLGDLELTFSVTTQLNALSNIAIEIPNKEIEKFAKEAGAEDLRKMIYEFLFDNTSIDFEKFDISKFKCNYLLISSDGKLRFSKGIPRLGPSDTIGFTAWDFVEKIYDIL